MDRKILKWGIRSEAPSEHRDDGPSGERSTTIGLRRVGPSGPKLGRSWLFQDQDIVSTARKACSSVPSKRTRVMERTMRNRGNDHYRRHRSMVMPLT